MIASATRGHGRAPAPGMSHRPPNRASSRRRDGSRDVTSRLTEGLAVAAGLSYLALLGLAIGQTTYDVWGALVVIPPLGLLGVLIIRTMFSGVLVTLRNILYAGLVAKLVGTALRYWVGIRGVRRRYRRPAVPRLRGPAFGRRARRPADRVRRDPHRHGHPVRRERHGLRLHARRLEQDGRLRRLRVHRLPRASSSS